MIILERVIHNLKIQLIKKQNGNFKVIIVDEANDQLLNLLLKDEDEALEKFYHNVCKLKMIRG